MLLDCFCSRLVTYELTPCKEGGRGQTQLKLCDKRITNLETGSRDRWLDLIGKCSNNSRLGLLTPALLNDTVNVTIIPCPDVVTDQSQQMTDHTGVEGDLWQGPLLGRGGCNPLQIQSGNRITEEDICTENNFFF